MCSWESDVGTGTRHERENRIDEIHRNRMQCLCFTICVYCVFCLILFSVCCLLYFGQIILGWNMPRTVDRMLAPARSWIPVTRAFPIQLPRALWVVGAAISVGHSACDSLMFFLFSHDTHYWVLRAHEGPAAILDKMTGSRRSNWVSLILLDGWLPAFCNFSRRIGFPRRSSVRASDQPPPADLQGSQPEPNCRNPKFWQSVGGAAQGGMCALTSAQTQTFPSDGTWKPGSLDGVWRRSGDFSSYV